MAVLIFAVLLMETLIARFAGPTGNIILAYNNTSVEVHDAAHASFDTIRWMIILALTIPMMCVWSLRDNVMDLSNYDEKTISERLVRTVSVSAVVIPLVTGLMAKVSSGDTHLGWLTNILLSVSVSVIIGTTLLYSNYWSRKEMYLAAGVIFALNLSHNLTLQGDTGEAFVYTFNFFVAVQLVRILTEDTDLMEEQDILVAAIMCFMAAIDVYLRKKGDRKYSGAVLAAAVATSYALLKTDDDLKYKWALGQGFGSTGEVAEYVWFFMLLNVLMNMNVDHLEHIPERVTNGVIPIILGGLGGYVFGTVKSSNAFETFLENAREISFSIDYDLREELKYV